MAWQRLELAITTSATGTFDETFEVSSGYIHSIHLEDTDLTATTDLTFTVERTGQAILFEADGGATETWYPRVFENKGADGDVLTTYTRVALANDRVRLVIANAGNGETARAFVTIADG